MRVGMALGLQNIKDWDRFLATERHETAQPRPLSSDMETWDAGIALALKAETLGFDSIFVPEHHFTPYCFSTNPLQLLTYFAARTERIDLGTMVVVLPWHHPLRVAEEATMLQNLLGAERNLLLGLGRGLAPREYASFGVDLNESRQRFKESVEILRLAVKSDRFAYEGTHYKIPETAMRPYPRDERLLENLYCAWGSPQSATVAAELGLKPFVIPQKPLERYAPEMETFARVRAGHGYEPANPMMVIWMFCAGTEAEARHGANEHMRAYARTPVLHYDLGGDQFSKVKGYEHYAAMSERAGSDKIAKTLGSVWVDNHVWGTPDQCVEKIEAIYRTWGLDNLIVMPKYGHMTPNVAEKSTLLFAKEVLPAVQRLAGPNHG